MLRPEDIVFFPLHILVDDGHADHLKEAFAAVYARNKTHCANAADLVRRVLKRRADMFSELKVHVESRMGGSICPYGAQPVTQSQAVEAAVRNANALLQPTWSLTQKMALAARLLADEGWLIFIHSACNFFFLQVMD